MYDCIRHCEGAKRPKQSSSSEIASTSFGAPSRNDGLTAMYSRKAIKAILKRVSKQKLSPQAAFQKLRHLSYETLGFARLDHHRPLRKNLPEVIYAPGKTLAQLEKITNALLRKKTPLLITRLEEDKFRKLKKRFPKLIFSKMARVAYVKSHKSEIASVALLPRNDVIARKSRRQRDDEAVSKYCVAIVTAGTSDIPIAEEARITLETIGRSVHCFYDLGVAGLHRLLDHLPEIEKADAIICIAGMEGALPSVLAGLISKPVIAVPTSVGYGSSFKGIAPLLTMLNTCAQGVAVVNIDSGFNAACFAHLMLSSD